MSLYDTATGFRRQLTYDETLNLINRQNADAGKVGGPGINREATRFVQSPFFERLKDSVYEGLQQQQVLTSLAQQNEANVRAASAETGVPPSLVSQMGPQGPPGPPGPSGPPGPNGNGGNGGSSSSSGARGGPDDRSATPAPPPLGKPDSTDSRGRSRTPHRGKQMDDGTYMDDDDDEPPPPPAAGAVRVSSSAGITPEIHAMVNQTRLEAELAKLAQERDIATRRAGIAESVANTLHAQKVNNPIFIAQQYFGNQPPPAPPSAPVPAATVNPAEVMKAVKAAMMGERRTLQEMMAHHGASFKEVVQDAVTKATAQSNASAHESLLVTPSDAAVQVPGKVKKIAKMFESPSKKTKAPAGGATAPMPTSEPPTLPTKRGTKRKERYDDSGDDLEDIYTFERRRDNPAPALLRAKKKKEREEIIAKRPLNYGPDAPPGGRKRKADSELVAPDRKRTNPAVRSQNLREAATKIMDALLQKSAPGRTQSKQDVRIATSRSVGRPIRMDQSDLKRSYDEVARDVDERFDDQARKRIGMTISDIQLPTRRAVA